jgi:hypothetical protein
LLFLFRFALAILRYGAWAYIRAEHSTAFTTSSAAERSKDAALNVVTFSKCYVTIKEEEDEVIAWCEVRTEPFVQQINNKLK